MSIETSDQSDPAPDDPSEQRVKQVSKIDEELEPLLNTLRGEIERLEEKARIEKEKKRREWIYVGLPSWIMAVTAVGALIISILSLGQSRVAQTSSESAVESATEARATAGKALEVVDNTVVGSSASEGSSPTGGLWLAQLASYRPSECGLAREAADRLNDKFGGETSLWLTASEAWIVLGVAQSTEQDAEKVITKAEASDAKFPLDTLQSLKVQRSPKERLNWSRFENCNELER